MLPSTSFTVVLMFVAEQVDVEPQACATAYKMVPFCGWNGRRECVTASMVDTTVATACLEEQDASAGSSVTVNPGVSAGYWNFGDSAR